LGNEIDSYNFPGCGRDRKRLGKGFRMLLMLQTVTGFTSVNIFLDEGAHRRPPELFIKLEESFMDSRVPCGRKVMALLNHITPQVGSIRNVNPTTIIDNTVFFVPFRQTIDHPTGSFPSEFVQGL
jgi:hypothetical protein